MADAAPNWSPYRFGFDNPLNFNDPSGLFEMGEGSITDTYSFGGPLGGSGGPSDGNKQASKEQMANADKAVNELNGLCNCAGYVNDNGVATWRPASASSQSSGSSRQGIGSVRSAGGGNGAVQSTFQSGGAVISQGGSTTYQANLRAAHAFYSYGGDGSGSFSDWGMYILDYVREWSPLTQVNDAVNIALWGTDSRGIPKEGVDVGYAIAAAIPFGSIETSITKRAGLRTIQKHHIIPNQINKEFRAKFQAIGWNQQHGLNLKKLPTSFHGHHPAYNKFVRNEILTLIRNNNLNMQSMKSLQDNLRSKINTIYLDKLSSRLNQHFKNLVK